MRSQNAARRFFPEFVPKDEHDAADDHARNVYVMIADALPGGRKSLGLKARRVSCFVNGTSAPTASDWQRLIAAGAPREDVCAYYLAAVDTLREVPVPEIEITLPTLLRENTETVTARLEYEHNPTSENLKKWQRESMDNRHAADLDARMSVREDHRRRMASVRAVRVLTETRPPLPARSDRRIAR